MPTPSPLAALCTTLANAYQQAQQYQQLFSKNEAATRAALIDPVLRALGWDTSDVTMVEPERTVQNKQSLDYVLKTASGGILAVLEAKKLGEPLDKLGHVGAVIGYAFSLKPATFFITDGLNWHGYSPGHSQFEPVVSLRLDAKTLLPTALQLLQWLDAAHGGHGLAGPVPAGEAATAPPKPIANPPKPTPPAASKPYVPLTAALALDSPGKPTWLRLPDGTEHPIKSWRDTLVKAAELVLQVFPNLPLPLADKAGKKTRLISWERPKAGLSNTTLTYQGKNVFIYLNYDATNCIANALYLLSLLPKPKQQIEPAVAFGS